MQQKVLLEAGVKTKRGGRQISNTRMAYNSSIVITDSILDGLAKNRKSRRISQKLHIQSAEITGNLQ